MLPGLHPCGRCGCQRRYHNPDKAYTSHKQYRNMNPNPAMHPPQIVVQARTCCDNCPHCICFCTGYVEPFAGQSFGDCVYAEPKRR